jgi:hypothetical protein
MFGLQRAKLQTPSSKHGANPLSCATTYRKTRGAVDFDENARRSNCDDASFGDAGIVYQPRLTALKISQWLSRFKGTELWTIGARLEDHSEPEGVRFQQWQGP